MKRSNLLTAITALLTLVFTLTVGCAQPFDAFDASYINAAKYTSGGYPLWIKGETDAKDNERYEYDGHMYQAKNNPGPWDSPAVGGTWFWEYLGKAESGTVDNNDTNTTFTPVNPKNANSIPDKVFAPYVDISKNGFPTLDEIEDNTSQKYFILSFINADSSGNPAWLRFDENNTNVIKNGASMDSKFARVTIMNQINALREAGGEIAISFGGAAGTELGSHSTNNTTAKIQAQYQKVIDRYNLTWMDMNLENDNAMPQMDSRMTALKNLQTNNPGLKISFQLMSSPSGLTDKAKSIVKKAKDAGIAIYSVGIMTMNFGTYYSQKSMGKYSIDAANATRTYLNSINLSATKIGICPMIGKNDTGNIFYQSCAKEVLAYANNNTSSINWLAMWSAYRDNQGGIGEAARADCSGITQKEWEFTNIFKGYTANSPASTPTPTFTPIPTVTATPIATATPIVTATATPVVTITPTPTPVSGILPWAAGTTYEDNDLVTYGGQVYKCIDGHYAYSNWIPSASHTLWQLQ